jgi:hypothetical protein
LEAFTGMSRASQNSSSSVRPGNRSRNSAIRQGASTLIDGSIASAASWKRHWSLPLPVAPCANTVAPSLCAMSTQTLLISGLAIEVPSR